MLVCGVSGLICRGFMLGFNRLEVNGGEKFRELLDERADVEGRTKGLITGMLLCGNGSVNLC